VVVDEEAGLSRVLLLHPESEEEQDHGHAHAAGSHGAASFSLHSFLDGIGIGLAFKVSTTVGAIVGAPSSRTISRTASTR
jgi:zinc transporter ZupT